MPDYLTLSLFKESLHYDGDDDTKLTALLDAAEGYIGDPENGILRRPVVVSSFTEKFNALSDVQIRFPDGATVTSVTYTDLDGQEQELGAIYALSGDTLEVSEGQSWPAHKYPVTVNYTAGFAEVPEQIMAAGYFYAGTLFEAQSDAGLMKPDLLRQLMCQMLAGYRRTTI